jgi:hypothetical protein
MNRLSGLSIVLETADRSRNVREYFKYPGKIRGDNRVRKDFFIADNEFYVTRLRFYFFYRSDQNTYKYRIDIRRESEIYDDFLKSLSHNSCQELVELITFLYHSPLQVNKEYGDILVRNFLKIFTDIALAEKNIMSVKD